jgi:MerR family redox-sensitive transcriptional activator SoxR
MRIGELAARSHIAPSAIRFYEKAGLLTPPARVSGRRVYDSDVLHQLALIGFAKDTGFTLNEIKLLLRGFPESTPASARWRKMATKKTLELDRALAHMTAMRAMLRFILRCRCTSLAQCARDFANSPDKWRIEGAYHYRRTSSRGRRQP